MLSRSQTDELLKQLENELKSLVIAYEQYFIGIEKRAPEQRRKKLTRLIRRMHGKYIPQTDLKFRLNGISNRYNSYCSYWDRILRLIEEGKYERHNSRIKRQADVGDPVVHASDEQQASSDSLDQLYERLVMAHNDCQMKAPTRQQLAKFLSKQESLIKERFGGHQLEFSVAIDNGRPKIKVRNKR
jgi:hypothetical protein